MDVLAAGCRHCQASCGPPSWAMVPTIPHPPHSKAGGWQGLTQPRGSSRFLPWAGHHGTRMAHGAGNIPWGAAALGDLLTPAPGVVP